jgi:hypothetical protein
MILTQYAVSRKRTRAFVARVVLVLAVCICMVASDEQLFDVPQRLRVLFLVVDHHTGE